MDIDNVVAYLDKLPIDYWDVFYERKKIFEVYLMNGSLKDVQGVDKSGVGIRIISNGVEKYFSTEAINDGNIIKEEIERLVRVDGNGKAKIENSSKEKGRYTIKPDFPEEPLSEIKELCHKFSSEKINNVEIAYESMILEREFINSNGAHIFQSIPRNRVAYFLSVIEYGKVTRYYDAIGELNKFIIDGLDDETIEERKKLVQKLAKARHPKAGTYDVVIDESLTGVLAHEAYGHSFESDLIERKQSALSDSFDEKIGNISIVDDPTEKCFGHFKYDDEGMRGRKRFLIKDGMFLEKIENLRFGRGGSGRRESYEDLPIPRMSNTYFLPGDYSDEELIGEVKDGYFLLDSIGGQVMRSFQFTCQYSYRIKNGEIKELCRGTTFTGDVRKAAEMIDGVGKERIMRAGRCEKDEQTIPVGIGGPKLLLRKIQLGGV